MHAIYDNIYNIWIGPKLNIIQTYDGSLYFLDQIKCKKNLPRVTFADIIVDPNIFDLKVVST